MGAYDANANFTAGPLTLIGEYITSGRSFASTDLTFNGHGALPSAGRIEMDYLVPYLPKKLATTLGLSYDRSDQALALNVQRDKYAVFVNTSIWRETIQSFEYNYQKDYSTADSGTGVGGPTPIIGTGESINTYLFQFGVYF